MIYIITGFSPSMLTPPGLSIDFVQVDVADVQARLRQPFKVCLKTRSERNRATVRRLAGDTGQPIHVSDSFEFKLQQGDILLICKDSTETPDIEYWEGYCYTLVGADE